MLAFRAAPQEHKVRRSLERQMARMAWQEEQDGSRAEGNDHNLGKILSDLNFGVNGRELCESFAAEDVRQPGEGFLPRLVGRDWQTCKHVNMHTYCTCICICICTCICIY